MILIKKIEEKYNDRVNSFIISIFVDEYKFEQYKEGLSKVNNLEYIRSGGNMWMAVDDSDEILGTIAIMKKDKNTAELKSFYVNKKYRGNGISKKLFSVAMEYCKQINLHKIFLGTYDKMETAICFYKKRGFSEMEMNHIDENARFFEMYL